MGNKIAVARVGRLFGDIRQGGLSITLYDTLPEEWDPTSEPLFVEIDSLAVPLYCDHFERRGRAGANVRFADFDTQRRAEELIGKELFLFEEEDEEADDEFYMEDLIGFTVEAGALRGEITDYYDSEMNPLFGIDFGEGERLIPAAEEFIVQIDFERGHIVMTLPDGLLEL
ncbi:MAG: 16S rRNA processing protein RimM [Alistipes sp.]|nr:16S rRNA processing protein RimM [Alistipes sp.]